MLVGAQRDVEAAFTGTPPLLSGFLLILLTPRGSCVL